MFCLKQEKKMKPVLSHTELNLALSGLKAWKLENNHLVKHFVFADFFRSFWVHESRSPAI